jgi:hypothetical protein
MFKTRKMAVEGLQGTQVVDDGTFFLCNLFAWHHQRDAGRVRHDLNRHHAVDHVFNPDLFDIPLDELAVGRARIEHGIRQDGEGRIHAVQQSGVGHLC